MSRSYLQPINNNIEKVSRVSEVEQRKEQCKEVEQQLEEAKGQPAAASPTGPGGEWTGQQDPEDQGTRTRTEASEADSGTEQDRDRDAAAQERLADWTPQSKCYFCVDGKLDSANHTHGGLVSTPSKSPFTFNDNLTIKTRELTTSDRDIGV